MRGFVFVGPTLRPSDFAAHEDIVCLPPVAQGDVYRVAQGRPRTIAIIDGYFEGVLSVWHKEILWAMAEGIHVLGSASMGALRAAELHPFGMQGVGRIFEAYRDGKLEDDDEVAVIHGPPETGYVALSEAMVNIRATLAEARRCDIIGAVTQDALVRIAKDLFYHERTFDRLLDGAAEKAVSGDQIEALRAWLPDGRVDQKREDALAMLRTMRALLESDDPVRVDYTLEWTEAWDQATASAAASRAGGTSGAGWIADDLVLDELRLQADAYAAVRDRTLLRVLARRDAERRGRPADRAVLGAALTRLRARHGLLRRADLDRWLEANGIGASRLERLLEDEAQLEGLAAIAGSTLRAGLLDELRLRDDFARFAARARAKRDALEARGFDQPRAQDARLAPPAVRAWYFEQRLGRPMPDDLDAAASELGFEGKAAFERALLREWLYFNENEESA